MKKAWFLRLSVICLAIRPDTTVAQPVDYPRDLLLNRYSLYLTKHDSLFDVALKKKDTGNIIDAIKYFDTILAVRHTDTGSYYNRALSWYTLGNYKDAERDLTAVIKLDASDKTAWLARAKTKYYLGQTESAIADLTHATRIDPQYDIAFSILGQLYTNEKNYKSARENLETATRLNAENRDAWFNKALVNNYLGRDAEAIRNYSVVLNLDASNKQAHINRGLSEHKLGLNQDALNDFSRAIQLDPKDPVAYNNRALAKNALGQYDDAISDFKTAMTLDPTDGYPFINIISPLIREYKYQEAIDYYDKCMQEHLTSFINDKNLRFYETFMNALRMILTNKPPNDVLDSLRHAALDYKSTSFDFQHKGIVLRGYSDLLAVEAAVLTKQKDFAEAVITWQQALIFSADQPDVKAALDSIGQIFNNRPFNLHLISVQKDTMYIPVGGADSTAITAEIPDIPHPVNVMINEMPVDFVANSGRFLFMVLPHSGYNNLELRFEDGNGNYFYGKFGFTAISNHDVPPAMHPPAQPTRIDPKYRAIIIAEQNYPDPNNYLPLNSPIPNARSLYTVLTQAYNFPPENIDTLYDESKIDILYKMTMVAATASDSVKGYDELLIFYSGHGDTIRIPGHDVDGYMVPIAGIRNFPGSLIGSYDITHALGGCNARHILFISDACFSGAFFAPSPPDRVVGLTATLWQNQLYNTVSRRIMTSGSLQPTPDQSKFQMALISNLKSNSSEYLNAFDLYSQIYNDFKTINATTIPQYDPLDGDRGGAFFFKHNPTTKSH